MKPTVHLALSICSVLIAISVCVSVSAGPVSDKDIAFNLTIPAGALGAGTWRMQFISVGEFERDNRSFSTHFDIITSDYLRFKTLCGSDGTFHEVIYNMTLEERAHKGCTINGTYQEEYCFKTVSDIPACNALAPYKLDDSGALDFGAYYGSAMWDIGRADFYNHYAPASCTVQDGACTFKLRKDTAPYNPYIIVLERTNSTDAIYFSDPVRIEDVRLFEDDALFACEEPGCDVLIERDLRTSTFALDASHKLRIGFDTRSSSQEIDHRPSPEGTTQTAKSVLDLISEWVRSIFTW